VLHMAGKHIISSPCSHHLDARDPSIAAFQSYVLGTLRRRCDVLSWYPHGEVKQHSHGLKIPMLVLGTRVTLPVRPPQSIRCSRVWSLSISTLPLVSFFWAHHTMRFSLTSLYVSGSCRSDPKLSLLEKCRDHQEITNVNAESGLYVARTT